MLQLFDHLLCVHFAFCFYLLGPEGVCNSLEVLCGFCDVCTDLDLTLWLVMSIEQVLLYIFPIG